MNALAEQQPGRTEGLPDFLTPEEETVLLRVRAIVDGVRAAGPDFDFPGVIKAVVDAGAKTAEAADVLPSTFVLGRVRFGLREGPKGTVEIRFEGAI